MFRKSRYFFGIFVMTVTFAFASHASALVVPFTEDFSEDAAGWISNGTNSLTWHKEGGIENQAFISTTATVNAGLDIVFRGNSTHFASDGAFVGNWLTAGVTTFKAYVKHDAPVPLNFFVRLNAGGMGYAACSNPITVKPNEWVLISIPIIDSLGPSGIWQSYEGAGKRFEAVFASIKDIQVGLDVAQPADVVGNTYHVGLAKVSTDVLKFAKCPKADSQHKNCL